MFEQCCQLYDCDVGKAVAYMYYHYHFDGSEADAIDHDYIFDCCFYWYCNVGVCHFFDCSIAVVDVIEAEAEEVQGFSFFWLDP